MAKTITRKNKKITSVIVRMYCMGTGDCFILKFYSGTEEKFTMMIDCGVWKGAKEHITPYMEDLKKYVNGKVNLLVITHEHLDHVSVFETCKDLFTKDFTVDKTWMAWTENDSLSKVKKWKTEFGQKKKALAIAAKKIDASLSDPGNTSLLMQAAKGESIIAAKKMFSTSLKNFADIHVQSVAGSYVGLLEGMRIAKKEIAKDNIDYFYPGDVIEDLPNLEGVKFYVLGPPEDWEAIKTEAGGEGESYHHNKELRGTDAFTASVLSNNENISSILPFDDHYESNPSNIYKNEKEAWRKIDDDWLYSAGSLALRLNSRTNNLSLALAIEFEDSKKVMLFPGDAEYGSWASWHDIKWKGVDSDIDFTKDLLKRTVFYKVAHHMSHNGTAQRPGLEMMEHGDLAAMATLDYDVIATAWKNTMPNQEMVQELLKRTKGRVMIMNEKDLFFDVDGKIPMSKKIKESRKKMSAKESADFTKSFKTEENRLFIQYTVKVQ